MRTSSFIVFTCFTILLSCNNNQEKDAALEKQNYEVTKEALKQKEQKNPQDFLFVSGSDKHNLFGQTVVKGSISNKASVAVYKDIDVQLYFYSKTGALLETDKETVYENINPGETKNFKTKYFAPKGSDSVSLKVLGAKISE